VKFGIHNPSWVFGPDPTEAFEGVKAKAQWAENHGFVWSVMDHMIQIGGVARPTSPSWKGWTVLSALAAVTSRIRVATLATSVGYRNPAHLAKIAERRATFQGRYLHAEDAILEPKPVQKPRPPVMIAGGGERLTLRAVARLADACNIGGDPEMVKDKLAGTARSL
jgi:alkanesulfonate monooxygenase SsuD/methylene tetrahydromethanopterin reductase-like flavin-dependent oxidoreductase (luciferase family)